MAFKDDSKLWFETGDKPTQAQFAQVFEWLRWKDEAVQMADIAGLIDALNARATNEALNTFIQGERVAYNADGFYDIPAGYLLEKMVILPGVDTNLKIGSTNGGEEIMPEIAILEAEGEVVVVNIFAKAVKRIYFVGLPANSAIVFFKRLVKPN